MVLPAKIKGLNRDTSDESNDEEEENPITKEALEQRTQQSYKDALVLQKHNKLDEAEKLLRDLLKSDVLARTNGRVKFVNGRLQPSLFHLKYCCYLNLGNILFKLKNYSSALENYLKATELDDTDLNLWFKIGTVAMKIPNLTFAICAYIEALRRNVRHWPSLDAIITATYATGDLMACLLFISHGLKLDRAYIKGLVLSDLIFKEHPFLKNDFKIFHPDSFSNLNSKITADYKEERNEILTEINRLKVEDTSLKRKCVHVDQTYSFFEGWSKGSKYHTWLCLGKSLLKLYRSLLVDEDGESFFMSVKLGEFYENAAQSVEPNTEISTITVNLNKVDPEDEAAAAKVASAPADELSDDGDDVLTELVSVSNKPSESDKEPIDGSSKPKRRKCSPTLADQLKICDKRRSTRNKTVLKSNEPSLSKSLQQLISKELRLEKDTLSKSNFYDLLRWSEDSFDTMDIYRLLFEHQEQNNLPSHPVNQLTEVTRHKLLREEGYFCTDKEKKDIEWFVRINNEQTILELLEAYLNELASKWSYTWPLKLADLFVEVYQILLKHGFLSNHLRIDDIRNRYQEFNDESFKTLEEKLKVVILYGELLLNQQLESGNQEQTLGNCVLGENFSSLLIGDIHDACSLLNATEKDVKSWMRAYWLEALIFLQKKDTFAACSALSILIEEIPDSSAEVRLPNMKHFHIISLPDARRLLNTLSRNQNLSEVKPLLLEKQYYRVVEILRETLKPDCKQLMHLPNETTLSRYQQYNLLLAALWESQNYEELFEWCEVSCYEAFTIYRKSFFDEIETEAKSKWASLVNNTLNCMFSCLKKAGPTVAQVLKPERFSRLVQTLCNLVCHQIEATEPSPEIIADVVTPWILLSNLIEIDENSNVTKASTETTIETVLPPSVSLLFVAHEHLGRRSWCCFNDGALLFYTLSVIESLFKNCVTWSEMWTTLSQQVDQIFYCLYSHPFKKNKPRHVQDHNSLGLALTWNRAVQAYSFYRPCVLPIFDAVSKVCTISGDTETLLKRMISLIPEDRHPARLVESVHRYLDGSLDVIPENENPLPQDVVDVFYLLGDYYFKNKIMGKAIKYYLLDICLNPRRIDSWSALALARGSQLEMKLNSCETISSEHDILKKADLTDKCYRTALELDFNQSTLWIEYGVFAYAIHAFCSRLLEQETTNLSLQRFDMLENQKEKFLKTSHRCFNSANDAWLALTSKQEDVQDERWLHHYMLGKIGEKREEKIDTYLNHYYEASKLLHQYGAEYPTRILYSSPQYYSVEALEIYYRIHASILKTLEAHEEKPLDSATIATFKMYIDKMAESPFMFARIKSTSSKSNDKSAKDETAVKKNPIAREANGEIREIVEEIIARVVCQTNKMQSSKRQVNDAASLSRFDQPAVKKFKTNSVTCVAVDENEQSDKSDECRLTASSTDEEDYKSKKKIESPQNVESDLNSPFEESSSDSSSSDSSSDSSESTDDSDSQEENKAIESDVATENRFDCQQTRKSLILACISALEECVRRFPEHYKSFYRLSHHYFRTRLDKNIDKARKLLIEEGGLFADRTNKNFFGGIWRIPTGEIDRPGSFAFHMSRSIHLLMDVLRDTQDYKTLLQLSNQLRCKPDLDKKYLRDNEREQLCKVALSLSSQALKRHIDHISVREKESIRRKLLLDVYKYYLRVSKNYAQKDGPFGKLLCAIYYKYTLRKEKASMEEVLSFCKTVDQITKSEQQVTNLSSLLEAAIDAEISKSMVAIQQLTPFETKSQLPVLSIVDTKVQAPVAKPKHVFASTTFAPSIPSNLKNLPPAITVTTVPQKKKTSPQPPPLWEKTSGQPTLSGNPVTKSPRQCVIVRTGGAAFKERLKVAKNEQLKMKRIALSSVGSANVVTTVTASSSSGTKSSSIEHNPCKSRSLMVEDAVERAISMKKNVTIVPTTTDDRTAVLAGVSFPKYSVSSSSAGKLVLVTSKGLPPELTAVGKERPSLIITPVQHQKGPTLQQKLAAKQLANSSNARAIQLPNNADAAVAKMTMAAVAVGNRNSYPSVDISQQLGSSGVSIFPVLSVDNSANGDGGGGSGNSSNPSHQLANLNRYVMRENEILSHFQSDSPYPTLTSAKQGSLTAASSPSSSSSSASSSSSPSPSSALAPHAHLMKTKAAKKSDHIDFNNLKSCHQGLIIEHTSSKMKCSSEAKVKRAPVGSEDVSGVTITPKVTKKSSSHIEVISLD